MKWTTRLISKFVVVQIASLLLGLLGLLIIGLFASTSSWNGNQWKYLNSIYGNDRDGIFGNRTPSRWNAWYWSAWRNSTNNFDEAHRFHGPLWYRTWFILGRQFYIKAGWESDGYISTSIGGGRGY